MRIYINKHIILYTYTSIEAFQHESTPAPSTSSFPFSFLFFTHSFYVPIQMNQNESTPGPTTSSVIGFLFRQYCSRHPLRLVYKGFLKNKIVLFCRTPLPGQAVTQATWTTLFVRRTVFVGMLLERKHCSVRERCS